MKRFDDLTTNELATLTDEEVSHYIDLDCAERGVPLLPPYPPKDPELPDAPTKDLTLYAVKRGYSTLFYCATAEAAQHIIDAIQAEHTYELSYIPGPTTEQYCNLSQDQTPHSIEAMRTYSSTGPMMWHRDVLNKRAHIVAEVKREQDAYRKAVEGREKVATGIMDRIDEARAEVRRVEFLTEEFDRYLALADGNGRVAARFLERAYSDAREKLPSLEWGEVEEKSNDRGAVREENELGVLL